MSDNKIPVSLFMSVAETSPDADELELDALTDPSQWIPADRKGDVPLYSPAMYGEGESRAESDPGPSFLTALVLDYDDGDTTPEAAFEAWAGFERYLHSTYSSTPAHPKFRLILPLAEPVPAHEWGEFWSVCAQIAEGQVDPTCKDPTRMFFAPSKPLAKKYSPIAMSAEGEDGLRLSFQAVLERDPTDRPSPKQHAGRALRLVPRPRQRDAAGPVGLFQGIEDDSVKVREEVPLSALLAVCPFMQHADDNAATLSEPAWRAQLSLLIRCHGGEDLAHEKSAEYPHYDEDETQGKIDRLSTVGPFTRSSIESTDEGVRLCPTCPNRETCVSGGGPLNLARAEYVPEGSEHLGKERDALRADLQEQTKALTQARMRRDHAANPDVKAEAAAEVVERSAVVTTLKQRLSKTVRKISKAAQKDEHRPESVDKDVWSTLALGRDETPKCNDWNLLQIFEADPLYQGLAFDELRSVVVDTAGRLNLTDFGDPGTGSGIVRDLAERYRMTGVAFGSIANPLIAAARRRSFHPVEDWLDSLPAWDGVDRAPALLDMLSGERDDVGLHVEYLRRTLIGSVARILDPGCKADTMLILQGEQGENKSTALQVLFEGSLPHETPLGWFSSTTLDLSKTDARLSIHRAWVTEFAELAAMGKKDSETTKAFMSERTDFFRRPYGMAVKDHHRRCVFVGTTNEANFLRDPTGARRFWVLPVKSAAKLGEIKAAREQLFAQALAEYRAGHPHYFKKGSKFEVEQRRVNAARWQTPDPVFEALLPWATSLQSGSEVRIRDAATKAGLIGSALTQSATKQVAQALHQLGFERRHTRSGNVWRKR